MIAVNATALRYDHAARSWIDPATGAAECRVCGDPVISDTRGVRHAGETAVHVTAGRAALPAVNASLAVVLAALRDLPDSASDADRAQAVVAALHARGALRQRLAATGPRDGALFAVPQVA